MFLFYLQFGFEHLLDWQGYDHMLFLLVLCVGYQVAEWRRVLVLVTAFTIGHSITLGMGALGMTLLPSSLVEFLIPVTIFLTAVDAWINRASKHVSRGAMNRKYLIAGMFGLIHGMGFSSQFLELEAEKNLLLTWFPFNLGIEIGQLVFVSVVMGLSWLVREKFGMPRKTWTTVVVLIAAVLSLWMIWERAGEL